MAILRYSLLTINWLSIAFMELLLLTAGLISPGHDKARLIPIAFAVIVVPAIGYALHRLINWLTGPKKADNSNG